jgi:hypothetical protein
VISVGRWIVTGLVAFLWCVLAAYDRDGGPDVQGHGVEGARRPHPARRPRARTPAHRRPREVSHPTATVSGRAGAVTPSDRLWHGMAGRWCERAPRASWATSSRAPSSTRWGPNRPTDRGHRGVDDWAWVGVPQPAGAMLGVRDGVGAGGGLLRHPSPGQGLPEPHRQPQELAAARAVRHQMMQHTGLDKDRHGHGLTRGVFVVWWLSGWRRRTSTTATTAPRRSTP